MSKKHTNTCYDCIHLATCYKIEHFGRDLETNLPCREFIGVNDRVEVVRCKECIHYSSNKPKSQLHRSGYCLLNEEVTDDKREPNDFCSYGERKELDNG